MTFIAISYSQILDLKFLLEASGLFSEMRINRELNIRSSGHILTMNDVQKEFIQTLANEDHVEKNVVLTGPAGLEKTLLSLEAINIKKAHYIKKHGISPSDRKSKLRVIVIGTIMDEMEQQLSESHKDCTLHIQRVSSPNSEELTKIFHSNGSYKSFSHTLIMLDDIQR